MRCDTLLQSAAAPHLRLPSRARHRPGCGGQHPRSHPRQQGAPHRRAAGELPYFNKDLATGNWSGFCLDMANDIAKLLDVKLEYTESTYGNSILDLQSNKIDVGFALNPTPQRALVVDFCGAVFHHPFGAMLKKDSKPGLGRHRQAGRYHCGRCRLRQ